MSIDITSRWKQKDKTTYQPVYDDLDLMPHALLHVQGFVDY
jgi:hypothetical protein